MRSGSGSHGSHSRSPAGGGATAPRIALTRTASNVSSDDDASISSREVAPPPPPPTRTRALPNFLGSDPAADAGRGEKRISLLRSAGTASSPDLATLVRKAKEKALAATGGGGGGSGSGGGKEHQRQSHGHSRYGASPALGIRNALSPNHTKPDHLPSRSTSASSGAGAGATSTTTTRQRSSTTVAPAEASSSTKGKLSKSRAQQDLSPAPTSSNRSPVSSDWITTNMRSRSDTVVSKGKSSVRSKTSAFLGKIIGQGSVRDKRGDIFSPTTPIATSYSESSFYQSDDAPPVPPLPSQHRSSATSTSPIADAFSRMSPVASGSKSPDLSKPLPPINRSRKSSLVTDEDSIDEEISLRLVDRIAPHVRSSSPERTIKGKAPETIGRVKRRSMSVSEADLKRAMTAGSMENGPSALSKEWDTGSEYSGSGVVKDFKGELSSQLDTISADSFDLKDPSMTTPRRATFGHDPSATLENARGRLQERAQRPQLRMILSSPASSDGHTPSLSVDTSTPSGTPNRAASLNITGKETARRNIKFGPRSARPSSTNIYAGTSGGTLGKDSSRLRVQHRSIASSSEPSLIPAQREENKNADAARTVRLVPSSTSVGWPEAISPALSLSMSSQTDLTEDTSTGRVSSSAASRDDPPDMDTRAKELAEKCWREDEEFLAREKIAEWLGGTGPIKKAALRHYIDFFDFTGLRLDVAFRRLCAKLYLKAETQQVDRILEEFSRRYWENNSGTVYGSASVVHAVSYSLLLLNTDLHVAELAQRMSRAQFVRNTLTAIQMQIRPNGVDRSSTPELTHDDGSSIRNLGSDGSDAGAGALRRGQRSSSVTSWNSISREFVNTPATTPNSGTSQTQLNESVTSVHDPKVKNSSVPSIVYGRNFDTDMENLLKEMYTAIKSHQILQPLNAIERASTSSGVHLTRNGSRRGQNDRVANLKRGSMRGIQSLFNTHGGQYGGGSYDGRSSPAPSFAHSAHEVGVNSFANSSSQFLPPTLGFASNLSHTIIREAQEDDDHSVNSEDTTSTSVSITDEELALLGAPWAKEGMLCRKQYYETVGKRAKSKQWLDVFVVIQKGELNMFTFGEGGGGGTMGVGGGNWLANAQSVGTVSLAHCLAHTLPPPGYSRQRPYCFVLTLPSGSVYFFQAGTEELVNEWVSTCNYWAARLSKEPLAGGVSNMEYGWNRVVTDSDERPSLSDEGKPSKDTDTLSMRSTRSWHSRRDVFTLRSASSPYSERVTIHDWKPPQPSTVPSANDEETQLEALQKHIGSMKAELNKHNVLRAPMLQLYAPRSTLANKAFANWERKSQHILAEIVKYEVYVDSLKLAMSLRLKKRGEKALEKALVDSSPREDAGESSRRWRGSPEAKQKPEDEGPTTPGATVQRSSRSSSQHRREMAET